jgi:hypothetical protein
VAGLALGACASGEASGTTAPATSGGDAEIAVTVLAGQVDPPLHREEVSVGQVVHLEVTADRTDQVHVHGINELVDITSGQPATITFTMPAPGVYDIELEDVRIPLVQLEVR